MPGMIQPERQLTFHPDDPNCITDVRVKSLFTGKWNDMPLPNINKTSWDRWQSGVYIQTALPHLTADQREFLLTGATPAEWDAAFKDED